MSQDTPTLSGSKDVEDDIIMQVRDSTPMGIVNIIVGQYQIASEAKARVLEEGIVVRNIGGLIIPHPAIKIQNDAERIIAGLLGKYAEGE